MQLDWIMEYSQVIGWVLGEEDDDCVVNEEVNSRGGDEAGV